MKEYEFEGETVETDDPGHRAVIELELLVSSA